MTELSFAVIGAGASVFSTHQKAIATVGGRIVGCCDVNGGVAAARAQELGCACVAEPAELLALRPDVAVVLAPHPFHASLAVEMLKGGCHVLVEKPVAANVGEAAEMVEVARSSGRLLAVCFQHRFRQTVQTARRLLTAGELGEIQTVRLTVAFPRSSSYYTASAWRGSWRGEAGAVLMNQGPHMLDLLVYLFGPAARVFAITRTQRHPIEAEDTADALIEWPGGAVGHVHISTCEGGQDEHIEIIGTRGTARMTPTQLVLCSFDMDAHIAHPEEFASLPTSTATLVSDGELGRHQNVYANLVAAIAGTEPLMTSGEAAAQSLELANAMILSGQRHTPVQLPVSATEYLNLLASLTSPS